MSVNFEEDGIIRKITTTAEDWVDSLDFDRIDHFTIQECLEFIKLSSQEVPEDSELVVLINKVRLECAERLYSLLGMKILPPLYGPGVSISGPTTYKNCDICKQSTHDTDECLPTAERSRMGLPTAERSRMGLPTAERSRMGLPGTKLPPAQTVFPKDCYLKSKYDSDDDDNPIRASNGEYSQDKWTDSSRESGTVFHYPPRGARWDCSPGNIRLGGGPDRRRFKDPREDSYPQRDGPQVTTLGEPCRDRSLDTGDNRPSLHYGKYWKYSSDEA